MKAFGIFPFQIAVNLRSIFEMKLTYIRERYWIQGIPNLRTVIICTTENKNDLNNLPIGIDSYNVWKKHH